jgi:hypothetical protein
MRPNPRISITFGATATGGGTGCPYGNYKFHLNDLFGPGIVVTVPWGQGAQNSLPITVTSGTHHWLKVEVQTVSYGNPGAIWCSPIAKPMLYKPSGTLDLSNWGSGVLTIN